MTKFQILTVLGVLIPHFCTDKNKMWHGGADLTELWSTPCVKFHIYRWNVLPLWGKKHFWIME